MFNCVIINFENSPSVRNVRYWTTIDVSRQSSRDNVADKEIAAKSRRSRSRTHPEIVDDAREGGRLEDDPRSTPPRLQEK